MGYVKRPMGLVGIGKNIRGTIAAVPKMTGFHEIMRFIDIRRSDPNQATHHQCQQPCFQGNGGASLGIILGHQFGSNLLLLQALLSG